MADDERKPGTEKKVVCEICFEETGSYQMFPICKSMHRYCISCVRKHVEVSYVTGKVAKCPRRLCDLFVDIDSCSAFLTRKIFEVMMERMKEATIPADSKVYCPNPRCSALMSKPYLTSKNVSTISDPEARKCSKCDNRFCLKCKVPWHYNKTCDDYQRSAFDPNGEKELMNLAKSKGWRQCGRCNNMIELHHGCYHMACRCGFEFCYKCGDQWRKDGSKCNCEFWNERFIVA